jgi:colicin import membrane protein
MSALTYSKFRQEPALGRSFALAFAMHAVLLAILVFGVRWQSHPTEAVTVELWDPPPPPPPPQVVEAPKPEPKVEPPKPEPEVKKPEPEVKKPEPEVKKPEPEVKKPDIVEKAPPPKPKPKPKPEVKPAPPKEDEFQKKMMREQLALEQRKFDEERRRVDEARRKADADRVAREQAAAARNKALDEYVNRIRAKVRQNWILPQDLQGNPEAVFTVVQLPTGEVIRVSLVKSSGNAGYDAAVERAIHKSSPLPLPVLREHFSRELKLTFRPRD